MRPIKDLVGQSFGKLTVSKFLYRKEGHTYWECLCKCGMCCSATSDSMKNGTTISCGCSKIKDLCGKKFGTWLASQFQYIKNRKAYWKCVCDCGNEKIMSRSWTQTGKIFCENCDTANRPIESLTNKKFGHLTIIGKESLKQHNKIYWLCKCDCDKQIIVRSDHLKRGLTKSCGCCKLIAEEELFEIINIIFPNCEVVRHYKDFILKKQHIDIAVKKDNKILCAIEYDGKQHFMPVTFGNMTKKQAISRLREQKRLDRKKNIILAKNKIRLIRFTFRDNINKDFVKTKLKEAKIL